MNITKYAPSTIFVAMILVAAPVAWVTLHAQQQAPALSALDYAEIGQLANRYAHAIDTCSNNGYDYADVFTADGVYESGNSGSRNGIAPMPSRNRKPPTTAVMKVCVFKRPRSRIASGLPRACLT